MRLLYRVWRRDRRDALVVHVCDLWQLVDLDRLFGTRYAHCDLRRLRDTNPNPSLSTHAHRFDGRSSWSTADRLVRTKWTQLIAVDTAGGVCRRTGQRHAFSYLGSGCDDIDRPARHVAHVAHALWTKNRTSRAATAATATRPRERSALASGNRVCNAR